MRHRATASGNGDFADDAEKQDSTSARKAPRATSRDSWERPLGTQESPERPFPFIYGRPRASVDAKLYPAVFRVIREIVVLTDPGATIQKHKIVMRALKPTLRSEARHPQL